MPDKQRSRRDRPPPSKPAGQAPRGRHEVRIIGGRWRGRKIRFPAGTMIRPSPDRVRETLFNWLAPTLRGARCLDLFAGSGALGFESLSRGAASAVFVERDAAAVAQLKSLAKALLAESACIVQADATGWLNRTGEPFDVVFLDPPFGSGLLPGLLGQLDRGGWLAPDARVYIECRRTDGVPALPAGWRMHRSGHAGDVGYYLAVGPAGDGPPLATDAGPDNEGGQST
jgi:16S rRNA (guanine966-N2)-methyltransferase